jgi:hypothetical protein
MQTETTTPRQFISRHEFSDATGLSVASIDNYVLRHIIKATRVGKRVLIPVSELQRLEREAGGEAA